MIISWQTVRQLEKFLSADKHPVVSTCKWQPYLPNFYIALSTGKLFVQEILSK